MAHVTVTLAHGGVRLRPKKGQPSCVYFATEAARDTDMKAADKCRTGGRLLVLPRRAFLQAVGEDMAAKLRLPQGIPAAAQELDDTHCVDMIEEWLRYWRLQNTVLTVNNFDAVAAAFVQRVAALNAEGIAHWHIACEHVVVHGGTTAAGTLRLADVTAWGGPITEQLAAKTIARVRASVETGSVDDLRFVPWQVLDDILQGAGDCMAGLRRLVEMTLGAAEAAKIVKPPRAARAVTAVETLRPYDAYAAEVVCCLWHCAFGKENAVRAFIQRALGVL